MSVQARLSNLGYFAMGKEATPGVAVIPSVFCPLYDDNMATHVNNDTDTPIVGLKVDSFQAIPGMRDHGGDVTVVAEPNTAAHILNALYTKGSTTGSNPYTHPFTLSTVTDPKTYTIDIKKGIHVWRFVGVQISQLDISFDKNIMKFKLKISALQSFQVREIASISTATITLKTDYSLTPTDGIVVGDTMNIQKASDSTVQVVTVQSLTGTTITFSTTPTSVSAGDLATISAQAPTLANLFPYIWTDTQYCLSLVDAATALSASQTRAEQSSKYTLNHTFEDDKGAQQSGSNDPGRLTRKVGGVDVTLKFAWDDAILHNKYLNAQKIALVVRHFSYMGNGQIYEMRVTLNNLRYTEKPVNSKVDDILYAEGKLKAYYDQTDAQAFDVKVVNALATI